MKPNTTKKMRVEENGGSILPDAKNGRASRISTIVNTDSGGGNLLGMASQFLLPSSYPPSRTAPFLQRFLGHFLSSFDNRNIHRTQMRSWYERLPSILNSSRCQTCLDSIHVFATDPWSTVPFALHPKKVTDKLIDILLLIPGCLSLCNQLYGCSGLNIELGQEMQLELESRASTLLQRLHIWWLEYIKDIARRSGKEASLLYGLGGGKCPSKPKEPYYLDTFTAACTASYHAAKIVLYSMVSFTSSQPQCYDSYIESHTGEVLAAATYVIRNDSSVVGTLMIISPLKIVCRWALDDLERQSALKTLELWGNNKGINGLYTQAFPLYRIPIISARTIHL